VPRSTNCLSPPKIDVCSHLRQAFEGLAFGVQIGFIDAITYYMNLKSDFVAFDDHLNRLLMESLALADAPDESLAGKPAEHRTHESIIALRVACIKMLTTAMGFEDFQKGPNQCYTHQDCLCVLQMPVL
jgi:phosphatidylinositol kinase/protein kinase (PI-3  family)